MSWANEVLRYRQVTFLVQDVEALFPETVSQSASGLPDVDSPRTFTQKNAIISNYWMRLSRILQVEESVIHGGRRPRWITPSEIGRPCIRLARGKFELTNQDSAGKKNASVLTSSWNQGTFVTGDGIKYLRKGIHNFKNQTSWQEVKNMNHFAFLSFYFGAKNGSPALCMATRS